MNKELTKKLVEDFPELYIGYTEPSAKNLMCFGFECGDGWFNLIYKLSEKLSNLEEIPIAMQVKEKFGGLRFYTGHNVDKAYVLISEAEEDSFTICEVCGDIGKLTGKGWYRTLCKNHE